MNLAINARDAMPGGGALTIDTAVVDADEGYTAAHPGLAPGSYVRLRAPHTGTGMPPEVRARVFEPFFTTKIKGSGTGPRAGDGLRDHHPGRRPGAGVLGGRHRHHDQRPHAPG